VSILGPGTRPNRQSAATVCAELRPRILSSLSCRATGEERAVIDLLSCGIYVVVLPRRQSRSESWPTHPFSNRVSYHSDSLDNCLCYRRTQQPAESSRVDFGTRSSAPARERLDTTCARTIRAETVDIPKISTFLPCNTLHTFTNQKSHSVEDCRLANGEASLGSVSLSNLGNAGRQLRPCQTHCCSPKQP
jgi:hypothetical protein